MAELGYPSVVVTGWTGIVAPTGTPPEILRRLRDEVVKILATADVREALSKAGAEPVGSTPEEFAAFIRSESVKWGAAVKQAGVTPE
jgi:tripartite-type tricarboxylate transporter receptor subunit TctC